ncbi:YdhR family protein [Escherichia coli]
MLPSEILIWQPEFTDKTLSRKPGAVQIYLFTDEKSALAYLEKHTARLKNLGVEEVVAKVFDVNEPLSQINQAKLA